MHRDFGGTARPQGFANDIGAYEAMENGNPEVRVTPRATSGGTGTLTAIVRDPDGSNNVSIVNILVNWALDGRQACYMAYVKSDRRLYLVDDIGTTLSRGIEAGGDSVGNSSCAVSLLSADESGDTVTISVKVSLSAEASKKGHIVYAAARDHSGGNSGWKTAGTWVASAADPASISVRVPSMMPSTTRARIATEFQHPRTGTDITNAQLLINRDLNGGAACYVGYSQITHALYLVNDGGPSLPLIGPLYMDGSDRSVENSQCRIRATSTVAVDGKSFVFSLDVELKQTLRGDLLVYSAAQQFDDRGRAVFNSGWHPVALWGAE